MIALNAVPFARIIKVLPNRKNIPTGINFVLWYRCAIPCYNSAKLEDYLLYNETLYGIPLGL